MSLLYLSRNDYAFYSSWKRNYQNLVEHLHMIHIKLQVYTQNIHIYFMGLQNYYMSNQVCLATTQIPY